jgi:uncharacterized protein YjiK
MKRSVFALLLFTTGAAACGRDAELSGEQLGLLAERQKQVDQRLAGASADSGAFTPIAKWILPEDLREISGVALMPDGRIVAHNDERGRVYVIDPKRGVILKQFSLGRSGVVADFEAIAVSGTEIFLLESNGRVYQFREGQSNKDVPFVVHDTKLGGECEFEGLAVEPSTRAFVLVCKVIDKRRDRNQVLIYRWLAQPGAAPQVSRISVPIAAAVGANGWKELAPSDIAIDPATGNYIVITGREKALIEITPGGQVVRSVPLPGDPQQPEGVAVTPDGILVISDEGVKRPADITLYRWHRTSEPAVATPSDTSTVN